MLIKRPAMHNGRLPVLTARLLIAGPLLAAGTPAISFAPRLMVQGKGLVSNTLTLRERPTTMKCFWHVSSTLSMAEPLLGGGCASRLPFRPAPEGTEWMNVQTLPIAYWAFFGAR